MDLGSRSGGGGGGENRYFFADNLHILNDIMTILFTLLCEISFTIYLNIYRVDFLRSFYVANFSKNLVKLLSLIDAISTYYHNIERVEILKNLRKSRTIWILANSAFFFFSRYLSPRYFVFRLPG